MTKKQIISLLSSLKPSSVKDLHIVYHNHNTHGSFSSLYDYRFNSFQPNELTKVLLSSYKLRACIKYVRVCYVDAGNITHFDEYIADDFTCTYNITDFLLINDLL